jgi:hypothetical protein
LTICGVSVLASRRALTFWICVACSFTVAMRASILGVEMENLFHLMEEAGIRQALLICALRNLPNVTLDSLPRQVLAQERAFVWPLSGGDWLRRCDAPGSHTCARDD